MQLAPSSDRNVPGIQRVGVGAGVGDIVGDAVGEGVGANVGGGVGLGVGDAVNAPCHSMFNGCVITFVASVVRYTRTTGLAPTKLLDEVNLYVANPETPFKRSHPFGHAPTAVHVAAYTLSLFSSVLMKKETYPNATAPLGTIQNVYCSLFR